MKKQQKSVSDTDNEPLVSIIIPVYNAEKYIDETIHSVINQTYKNWELLLIDNCSTDSSLNKLYEYESNTVRVFKTNFNSGGPAVPRNLGIQHARGKYLAFLDADDLWEPQKLEVQLQYLQSNDFVCSLSSIIDDESKLKKRASPTRNKHYTFCDLMKRNRVIHSSVMVSRDKFSSVMFDEDVLLQAFEDYHAYMTYAFLHGPILVIGEALIRYRDLTSSLGGGMAVSERLTKSLYCLIKIILASKHYKYCSVGVVRRYLSYIRKRGKELYLVLLRHGAAR